MDVDGEINQRKRKADLDDDVDHDQRNRRYPKKKKEADMDVESEINQRKRKNDLTNDEDIDIVVDEMMKNRTLFKRKRVNDYHNVVSTIPYDDRPMLSNGQRTHNIFRMSPHERKHFLTSHPNPYNYPQQYIDLYREECKYRKPMGYDHCYDITNVKLFKSNDELNTKIRNITNINCIKSVDPVESEVNYEMSVSDLKYEDMYDFFPRLYIKDFDAKLKSVDVDTDLYTEYYLNPSESDFEEHMTKIEKHVQMMSDAHQKYGRAVAYKGMFPSVYSIVLGLLAGKTGIQELNDAQNQIDLLILRYHKLDARVNRKAEEMLEEIYNQYSDAIQRHFGLMSEFEICISQIFSRIPQKYRKNCVIGGGAALALYTKLNYNYELDYSDIDIFIHGLEGREHEFVHDMMDSFSELDCRYSYTNGAFQIHDSKFITVSRNMGEMMDDVSIPIQIILRSYCSPSEVIHGFDIDASCICVNDEMKIFATKRFMYAVSNGYNTVNFERLSPSYSHRLYKYYKRGFAIWIPEIEYLKDTCVFDLRYLNRLHCGILIRKIMTGSYGYKGKINRTEPTEENTTDYGNYNIKKIKFWSGDTRESNIMRLKNTLTFITIDPGQQISSTFNKEVLEDPITWYPYKKREPENEDIEIGEGLSLDDFHGEQIVEVFPGPIKNYYSKQIISQTGILPRKNENIEINNFIVNRLRRIVPNFVVDKLFAYNLFAGTSRFLNKCSIYVDPQYCNRNFHAAMMFEANKCFTILNTIQTFIKQNKNNAEMREHGLRYYNAILQGHIDVDSVLKFSYMRDDLDAIFDINLAMEEIANTYDQIEYLFGFETLVIRHINMTENLKRKNSNIRTMPERLVIFEPMDDSLKYMFYQTLSHNYCQRKPTYQMLREVITDPEDLVKFDTLVKEENWSNAFSPQTGFFQDLTITKFDKKRDRHWISNYDIYFSVFNSTLIGDRFTKPISELTDSDILEIFDKLTVPDSNFSQRDNRPFIYVNGRIFTKDSVYKLILIRNVDENALKVLPYPSWQNFIVDPDFVQPQVKIHAPAVSRFHR